MKESLFERMEDEFGNIDFRRTSGMSKSKEVSRFVAALHKNALEKNDSVFTAQEMYIIATKIGLNYGNNFNDFVDNLNTQNYLLKKGANKFKLVTAP
jgi:DNA helicase MCM8